MSSADTVITALRSGHEGLAGVVRGLGEDDLARTSGASEWDVSQVLSHLGSGAEISQAGLRAAIGGVSRPTGDFNQSVWDRWNAMSRQERADGFVRASQELTELYESFDQATRDELRIDLGFTPEPVDVETHARMRLNELALHSWDVNVAFDEQAALPAEAVDSLLHDTSLLGWIAKSEHLGGERSVVQVETREPDEVFTLDLGDRVNVVFEKPADPDGTLILPAEAWLRLVAGRLSAQYTPADVRTAGAAHLDLLRKVFPGY